MATSIKEDAQMKERRIQSSSSPSISSPRGRRMSKLASSGSRGRGISTVLEKSTPHYPKSTVSTSHELHKPSKKPAPNSVTPRKSFDKSPSPSQTPRKSFDKFPSPSQTPRTMTTRKSFDKFPPPSETPRTLTTTKSFDRFPSPSQTPRTPTFTGPREKLLRPSCHSPRTVSLPRSVSDKAPKTPRNGNVRQLVKAKSLTRECSLKKRESKASPATSRMKSSIRYTPKTSIIMPEIELEILKVDGEEQALHEIQPIDYVDMELNACEINMLEGCYTSLPLEVHEATAVEEEIEKKNDECNGDSHQEEKKQDENDGLEDEEHPLKLEEEGGDADGELISNAGGRSEEIEKAEKGNLDTKVQEVVGNDDPKLEVEKVEPQRQNVRGKKNAPAYNDVIEETASKLVEKRKSKVKALVGAFESVISLEEPESQGVL